MPRMTNRSARMTNVSTQIPPQSMHDKIIFSSVLAIDLLQCLNFSSAVQCVNCYCFLVTVGFSRCRAGRYQLNLIFSERLIKPPAWKSVAVT